MKYWVSLILILATAQACVQVELVSIVNKGNFTFSLYRSEQESLQIVFGVGNLFFSEVSYLFSRNGRMTPRPGTISFPCFESEALWFDVLNDDEQSKDRAQISIDCRNLQPGSNTLTLSMYERAESISTIAGVEKLSPRAQYKFFDKS